MEPVGSLPAGIKAPLNVLPDKLNWENISIALKGLCLKILTIEPLCLIRVTFIRELVCKPVAIDFVWKS